MALEDRVAIITGGTGQLGRAVTLRFLDEGASVVVPWHTEDGWRALEDELTDEQARRCLGLRADVTDEEQVKRLVDATVERFAGLDVLLNLVGGFAFGQRVWETDLAAWDRMMDLNVKSAFLCSKHALRVMRARGRGRIVNVSSKAAVDVQPGAAAYAVSKAAVVTLTQALYEELKGTGIAVNAIMPGVIDTAVTRELMPGADRGKWVSPERIAGVLVALCSDEMEAVSGSVVRIFGGV